MLLEASTGTESGKITEGTTEGGLVFGRDGARLYSATFIGTLMEWDVVSRKLLRKSSFPPKPNMRRRHVSLSPDGNTVVTAGPWPPLFDVSGKEIIPLNRYEAQMAPRFIGDGKHLMSEDGNSVRPSLQKWDAVTGKSLGTIKPVIEPSHLARISLDGKFGIKWANSGTSSKAGQAHLFEVGSGKEIGKIQDDITRKTHLLPYALFSPDSKILALLWVPQTQIELYDATTAKLLATLNLPLINKGQGGGIQDRPTMLFSADGKTLAFQRSIKPTEITLFDVSSAKQKKVSISIPKQNSSVSSIGLQGAFSPDGRSLAIVSERKVTLYELATGQPRLTFDAEVASQSTVITTHGYAVAFSPDGNRLAIAGASNIVHLADTLTGRDLATFRGHRAPLTGVAYAPDGRTVASSSHDGTLLIWDVTKVVRPKQ
ncbi:MAG TPA: hypothetical protein VE988_16820 [Gemmataceae bacterium]|nr:hypothetical protein [Gemmataceae bacterium]